MYDKPPPSVPSPDQRALVRWQEMVAGCENVVGVLIDINAADDAKGAALLLHPHPDMGGNRLHPFIDGVFQRLPDVGVTAVRFDFSSGEVSAAAGEAGAAVTDIDALHPGLPIAVAGYSFGAAVATKIFDDRVVGWYLLAPPVDALATTAIGFLARRKAVVVPERDQYSPPPTIAPVISRWQATDASTLPHADHFLAGGLEPVIESAVQWIADVIAGNGGPDHERGME